MASYDVASNVCLALATGGGAYSAGGTATSGSGGGSFAEAGGRCTQCPCRTRLVAR